MAAISPLVSPWRNVTFCVGDGPAAVGHDLAITLDGLLERGDRGLADERHVDAVGGAQAIVEIGAHLLAARLLFAA